MICKVGVKSKVALAIHLKHYHPEKRPYWCVDCLNLFNNNNDLLSHRSNVHAEHTMHCKSCGYSTTLKARMCQYVYSHTRGLKCGECGKSYPNKHTLGKHKLLHEWRSEFVCTMCLKIFPTSNSKCEIYM